MIQAPPGHGDGHGEVIDALAMASGVRGHDLGAGSPHVLLRRWLSDEVDPGSGELLGNFPQAFSHIGLVNAAWAVAQAEGGDADEPSW